MEFENPLLVTAGEDIKIWDMNTFVLKKQYNPHNSSMSCVSWTPDFKIIASASTSGDKIVLTTADHFWQEKEILIKKKQITLNYSTDNQLMVTGGLDGSVYIYSLLDFEVKDSFKFAEFPMSSVLFMNNNENIVAANKTGDVYISRAEQPASKLRFTGPIQHIDKSLFQKNIFASAEEDGSISIWDVESCKLVNHKSNCHSRTSRQLSFSPYNEMLMTSVGNGTGIVIHDTRTYINVQVINNMADMHSVKMLHDGYSIVVGDSLGALTSYDIRDTTQPILTMNVHKSPIACLSCSNKCTDPSMGANSLFSPIRCSLGTRDSLRYSYNEHMSLPHNISRTSLIPDQFSNISDRSINELSKESPSINNKEIKELSSKMDKMIDGFTNFKEEINQKLNSVHFKLSYKLTIMEDLIRKSQVNNVLLEKLIEEVSDLQEEIENLKCVY